MSNIIYYVSLSLLLISTGFMCYVLVYRAFNQEYFKKIKDNIEIINERYHEDLIRRRERQKKLRLRKNKDVMFRLNILIDRTGLRSSKLFWYLNPQILILMCICSSFFIYVIFEDLLKMVSVGLIMAVPGFFLPTAVLGFIAQRKEDNIERILGNFLLQLKNSTRIHNDIIEAFRTVKDGTVEPLQTHIKQFLAEINSGVSVDEALNNFKEKINIERFKLFLTNIQYCYTYGGNFSELLDNTHKLIADIQSEKRKRIQETRSARIVLFILMALDLYIYFSFIKAQPEYMNIMRSTITGQAILYVNFLSMWGLLWLAYAVRKLDY